MKSNKEKQIIRYDCPINIGLTKSQVKEREIQKLTNKTKTNSGKSVFKIFFDNICTFFNFIWLVVFVALLVVGAYTDLLFIIVIILNTTIAIIQELKAKHTVEKLSYITSPKISVIRDGETQQVPSSKLCLDDIIILTTGNQIPCDSILLEGKIEVNESLLTGESLAVKKEVGDTLYAGSFLISGTCYAKINKIGKDSYIQSVAVQAKKFKSPSSNLFKDINSLVKYIGIIIIPIGGLMLLNNYFAYSKNLSAAIAKTCGSITGMVPAGMFLLITIALSLGVIKLSHKKTLVQNIYSIEMLARTNVLCLDKTGTITDGTMSVCGHVDLYNVKGIDNKTIISNILNSQSATNSTSSAMIKYYKCSNDFFVLNNVEFSSKRKCIITTFDSLGTFAIGAPEFLHLGNIDKEIEKAMFLYQQDGKRVLMLAYSDEIVLKDELPLKMKPLAIIVIEDHIREDAIETINWFKNNGVKIKIISGDNPYTVANIAKRVGIEDADACVSLEGMSLAEVEKIATNFTVFGRVSPEQKHVIIKALKKQGNTVAMTGDGVNDTLALKEADCSIAMADGSDVARSLSNIVLLNSKFSSLPSVVWEGRRVINNVQRSSTLFLMKTVFTILLSLLTIITLSPYPFSPSQLLPLEMFVIGLPSVVLALQPNTNLIKGDFIPEVLKRALPNGLLMLFNVLIVIFLANINYINASEYQTVSTLVLMGSGLINLIYLCVPFNVLRIICCSASGILLTISTIILGKFFGITDFTLKVILILLSIISISIPLHLYIPKFSDFLYEKVKKVDNKVREKHKKRKEKKKKIKKGEILLNDLEDEE